MTRKILRLLLCGVLGAVLLALAPTAVADAPVTVRGRITDEQGSPLADVTVEVVDWHYRGGSLITSVKTDADGRYRVSYTLADDPVDYIDVSIAGYYLEERPIAGLRGRTYTVDLMMRRPPIISGHVVDPAGDPVPSGTVAVVDTVPGGDCPRGISTDLDNRYCVEYGSEASLHEGDFEARVWSGALFSLVVRSPGFATEVVHGVSPEDDVDITLTPGDSAVAPVTVTGVVRDGDGLARGGVEVVATDPDTARENVEDDSPDVARATTDDDGSYNLSFDPLSIDNIERPLMLRVETPDGPVEWPAGDISVGHYYQPGMTVTADIRLGPAGTVAGEVRDEHGDLLPDVTVCCGLDSASATTDAAGRYSLLVLPGHGWVHVAGAPCGGSCNGYREYVAQPGVDTPVDISLELIAGPEEPPPPEPDVTRPAPPQNVRAVKVHPTRVKLRFRPAYSGGRPITRFQAACAGWHNQAPEHRARGAHSPIAVGQLRPDRRYLCRVRARNALGWSRWTTSRWFETSPR